MKKLHKIGLVVLILMMILCVVLVACDNTPAHEHNYSQVGKDENNHWNECPDDQVKDESSIAPHSYKWESDANQHWKVCSACGYIVENSRANHVDSDENGKCDDCNRIVEIPTKSGSISGTISLKKQGEVTQSGKDVTITIKQDGEAVTPTDLVVEDNGTFSFSAIEGEYVIQVQKTGYLKAQETITLAQATPIEGKAFTLEYNLMSVATVPNCDGQYIEFDHQNDENAYILSNCTENGKTFDIMTVDAYDNASFTYLAKKGHSSALQSRVGVMIQFFNETEGKTDFLWWNVKTDDETVDKIEWLNEGLWAEWTNLRCVATAWNTITMSAEESAQYAEGSLKIGIARYENMIFGLVNGVVRDTVILDEKYADMEAHFAIIGQDVMSEDGVNKFYFEIESGIEDLLPETKHTITLPTVENLTMTSSRTECYDGQGFVVSFEPADGYAVTSFKVGDVEYFSQIKNNKVTVSNYKGESISVVMGKRVDFSLAVVDKSGNAISDIEKLTFTNANGSFDLDIASGKFTAQSVLPSEYTVTADNEKYASTIVTLVDGKLPENLVFVEKDFNDADIIGWGDKIAQVYNMATGDLEIHANGTVIHATQEEYNQVAFTTYLKKSNAREYSGAFVKFGNQYFRINIKHDSSVLGAIEWNCDTYMHDSWGNPGENATGSSWDGFGPNSWWFFDENGKGAYNYNEDENKQKVRTNIFLSDEELAMFEAGTLKLTLVRNGKTVYVFINGRYIGSRSNNALQDSKVTVGAVNWGTNSGAVINYDIETDISKYLAVCEGESEFKFVIDGNAELLNITGNLTGYSVNDLVELSIAPAQYCEITSFKVNGVDARYQDGFKFRLLDKNRENITITIEGKRSAPVKVNATIAESLGYNGLDLVLVSGETKYTGTIADNNATIDTYTGTYQLYIAYQGNNYAIGEATIGDDGALTISEDAKFGILRTDDIWNWSKYVTEVFNPSTGKGTATLTGDNLIHETANGYDSFAITHYIKSFDVEGAGNKGIFVKFGNDYVWLNLKSDLSIEWNCDNYMHKDWGNPGWNISESTYDGFGPNSWWVYNEKGEGMYQTGNNFSNDDKTSYESGELKLTLVRHGSMVYAFVNDRYIGFRNVGDKYNDVKATAGLISREIKYSTINYLFETDITKYLAICEAESSFKFEITSNNENYDIVDGKVEGYHVSDYALIGFNAKAGYVITGMKVDGEEVSISTMVKRWVNSATLANVKIELTIASADESPELVQDIIGNANVGDASKLDFSTKGTIKILDNTDLFAATANRYGNGAISVTFKKGLTSGDVMGIGYAFGTGNMGAAGLNKPIDYNSVSFRIENNGDTSKVQWVGNWDFGLQPVHWTWDVDSNVAGYNPLNAELYNAYATGDGITITLVRQDNVFYALVNGVIVSTEYISGYEGYLGRFYVLAHGAQKDQTVSYTLLDAEAAKKLVADAQTVISGDAETKVSSFIGSVSYDEGKVKFDGSGIVSVGEGSLNESLTMNVGTKYAESDASAQMGIMYRFADGRFVYVRSEKTGDNAFKIQYSQDSVLNRAGDAYLKGWTDYQQEDEDVINAFFSDSVAITLVRNGNVITIKCGETVLNTLTLDEKYAEMDGQMMVEVDRGSNTAVEFTYENIANASVGE